MRTITINNHLLTEAQANCFRAILVFELENLNGPMRARPNRPAAEFYYRQNSFTLLQLIDNDPLISIMSYARLDGWPDSTIENEPVILMDGIRLNSLMSMQTRMIIGAGAGIDDIFAVYHEMRIPMAKTDELVDIVYNQ